MVKSLPAVRETQVQSLCREDPMEKEMATHSSILAWQIPWMEKPGRLQSMGLRRVGHNWATSLCLLWKHFPEREAKTGKANPQSVYIHQRLATNDADAKVAETTVRAMGEATTKKHECACVCVCVCARAHAPMDVWWGGIDVGHVESVLDDSRVLRIWKCPNRIQKFHILHDYV